MTPPDPGRPALALALLAAFPATAQPVPSAAPAVPPPAAAAEPGRRVTLDEALRAAGRSSLDLKAAQARLDQAAISIGQAWANLLPQVTAQGKYTHNYREVILSNLPGAPVILKGEQLDASLAATVPLVVPWAWFQLRSARDSVGAAGADFQATRADVLLAVAQAFYLAAGADDKLAARRHAIEVAQRTLDDARAKVEAGTANRVEVTRAQLAHERAVQAAVQAAADRDKAYLGLATATGLPLPFVVHDAALPVAALDPGPGPGPGPGPAPGGDLLSQALRLRPEFARAAGNAASFREAERASLWRWAPTLSAFGNVKAFNYAGFSGDQYSAQLGAQLDWTLYDGGLRDAQRWQARAQAAEQQALLDKLRLTVHDDVENARRDVEVKRSALETARHAATLSRETLELVRVQHGAGTSTQLDLLTAQDQLVGAELDLAQARFDLALAAVTLQKQVGTFPGPASLDR